MSKHTLVSIIMPSFNRAYIIRKAIASIAAQTYPHWELIVMDDGSIDTTEEVIQGASDGRVKYYRQSNAGPALARHHALKKASGDFIAYLDSDNELSPRYLETMLEQFGQHSNALYGIPQGNYTHELYLDGELVDTVDRSDQFLPEVTIRDIFHRKLHFDMNGFMHKRHVYGDGIEFDANLSGLEDWDLVLQIGARYPEGFLYVPEVLFNYRQRFGADGLVSNKNVSYKDHAKKFEEIYEKHKQAPLMEGQAWYPQRVEHWRGLEEAYQAGKLPPAYLFPFPNYWPEALKGNADIYR